MIDQFVSKGVLIPDISCSHASSLVTMQKQEWVFEWQWIIGRSINLRVCTTLPRYAIPTAAKSQVCCAKVDNLWGYHQLKFDKACSRVTTIITPCGVYSLSYPFGISTAPG